MAPLPIYVAQSTVRIIRLFPRLFQYFFALYVALASAWLLLGLLPGLAQTLPAVHQMLLNLRQSTSSFPVLNDLVRRVMVAEYLSEPPVLLFFQYFFSVVNLLFGILLMRLRPHDWVARWLALGTVGTAAIFNLQTHVLLNLGLEFMNVVHEVFHFFAGGSYLLALLLFPNGDLPPLPLRGRLDPIGRFFGRILIFLFFFQIGAMLTFDGEPAAFVLLFGMLAPIVGISAQALRYVRSTTMEEGQLCMTLILALGLGLCLTLVIGLAALLLATPLFQPSLAFSVTLERVTFVVFPLLYTMIPFSLTVIVLRYRLWALEWLIHRSLIYGALTIVIAVLYIIVVGGLGMLLRGQMNLLLAALVTGLIALIVHPLRLRLQQATNRLLYGERDDPVTVLETLGKQLDVAATPQATLQRVVATVAQALKLPYVAIRLYQDGQESIVASQGQTELPIISLALVFQHQPMGFLDVGQRSPGEALTTADHRLLTEIAQKASAAVHAAQLASALQHARERLITTREEERRRLRRDLHDGLGPQLATLSLQVDAARNLVVNDRQSSDQLLAEIKAQVQTAIGDIRRLVYDLRPPTLDQLGLVSALNEYIVSQNTHNSLRITLYAPEHLPVLPAAVEVAAYRIVLEALTNVTRHAQAQSCLVHLQLEDGRPATADEMPRFTGCDARGLVLEISDDGVGLSVQAQAGVGLTSMRERAEELGGTFMITSSPTCGTQLRILLPFPIA